MGMSHGEVPSGLDHDPRFCRKPREIIDEVASRKSKDPIKEAVEIAFKADAKSLSMLERAGVTTSTLGAPAAPPQPAPSPASAVPPPVAPAAHGTFVYGDGNVVQEGDIVQDGNQTLAEVRTVAGNGIVLDIPAQGVQVVAPADLLGYKKLGSKRRA